MAKANTGDSPRNTRKPKWPKGVRQIKALEITRKCGHREIWIAPQPVEKLYELTHTVCDSEACEQ